MAPADMTTFAQNYAKAWCSDDAGRVAAFFSPNGSLKVNDGAPATGRVAIAALARGFITAFPNMIVSFDRLAHERGRMQFHWTLTGTNTGPGGTGKFVRISGCEDWGFGSDGLIAESLGRFDGAEYERQLRLGVV